MMQLLRWPLPGSRRVARPIVRAAAVLLASLAVLSGPAVIGPAMAEPVAGNEETSATPAADAKKNMRVIYLGKEYPEPLPLSYSEKLITDKGIQGARLMLKEANQAGNFIGYSFEMVEEIGPADGDVVAKAKEALANGERFFIADLEPEDLLAVADLPGAKDALIMNIRSSATSLRQADCRANVFHIIPDYAMRADAIAQYLIWKKWPKWLVVRRDTKEDQDYLAQVKRSAARFGARWSRTMSIGWRLAPGTWTQATSRFSRRSPWKPRAPPTTTWFGPSTRMTTLATTSCTGPLCPGPSLVPKAFRRRLGTNPTRSPGACISRMPSRALQIVIRSSATTQPGSASVLSPMRP